MRTVDPRLWSKKLKKPPIKTTRPLKYGQKTFDGIEFHIRASFGDAMRELHKNFHIRGVKCNDNMSEFGRYFHTFIRLTTVFVGISVVWYYWWVWSSMPLLAVHPQSSQHSIRRVPFPAVALCPTNPISAGPLWNYTQMLVSKDKNITYTEPVIRENLLKFGALLDRSYAPVDVMFMQFLMTYDPEFNVTDFMFKLSPQCDTLLKRCSWRGRLVPCEKLFASRITSLGFCCVFNSQYQPVDTQTPPKFLDMVGPDYGLSVVVTKNDDDFAYLRRPMVGIEVLLFDGTQFPLLESGAVSIIPVAQNSSMFLSLSVQAQIPHDGLRYYGANWRGCRLRSSINRNSAWRGQPWCLTECRRQTVTALCSCAPFTLLQSGVGDPVCTLNDLVCLNKYREKLLYYYPGENSHPSLSEEEQDAQYCQHCAPDCLRYVYSASLSHVQYGYKDRIFQNFFTKDLSLVNTSVIRLFYDTQDQRLFTIEVNVRWFEVFSAVSSQWAIITGVTITAASELIFHFTVRWLHHLVRRIRTARRGNLAKFASSSK